VEVEIDNARHLFKPGMFGRSETIIERFSNIVVVPRTAIISQENRNYVFVVSGDRAGERQVSLGTEFNGSVQIIDGINPGDSVITVGQEYLDDGYKIKLAGFVDARGKEIEL
jgi:multidrug efflux pump subunit AcrA (membrane-fusion protein)